MKINNRTSLVILMTVLLAVTAVTSAIAIESTLHEEKQKVFEGEIIGTNSYKDPMFDVTCYDLVNAGYSEGDMFDVVILGKTIHKATFTHNYLGVFMFETYLNTEEGGNLAAGSYWGITIAKDVGTKVTITYSGHNENYSKLDKSLVNFTNNLEDYDGNVEAFANFYMVSGGDLKDGKLYRSYNPYSTASRSTYVNSLADQNGIGYVVSLSMNSDKIQSSIAKGVSGYCIDLFQNGNNTADDITYKYLIQKEKLKTILTDMSDNDGPYLVHCNVGRDRTGFMVTLLQALCGANETEMAESAANAYVNLYKVVKGSEEYKVIESCTYEKNIYYICNYDKISTDITDDNMPLDMTGKSVKGVDTKKAAYAFCTEYLGMESSAVDRLISNLCS